jgi:hypothetical protein
MAPAPWLPHPTKDCQRLSSHRTQEAPPSAQKTPSRNATCTLHRASNYRRIRARHSSNNYCRPSHSTSLRNCRHRCRRARTRRGCRSKRGTCWWTRGCVCPHIRYFKVRVVVFGAARPYDVIVVLPYVYVLTELRLRDRELTQSPVGPEAPHVALYTAPRPALQRKPNQQF